MRPLILASVLGLSLGATTKFDAITRPAVVDANPCEMDVRRNASARSWVRGVLIDTGQAGVTFANTRNQLGISGVAYEQVTIVQDTVKCRSAINAWKSFYAGLDSTLGVQASQYNTGMLFQITPNRFILSTPMLNKYSFLTYIAFDSNFVVVRKNL